MVIVLILDVRSVEVNLRQQKLTVGGCVDPAKVLKKVKETGKRAEMWLYVPYNLSYDKKAPSGYVKSTMDNPAPPPPDQGYTMLFSDDNPNACIIM
ncbi:hypothetical protein AMTR_s00202p00016130 [Amborella trichopoda]|uniref:HMA domain-containing protein n=1 Tax=Amborella trichopoda TaxID=13333 RepID=W1NLM9_AMBTC|nr:hypothetical protein AMTR_s00202p00016130 [Amborella trichopoda]